MADSPPIQERKARAKSHDMSGLSAIAQGIGRGEKVCESLKTRTLKPMIITKKANLH